MRDEARGEPTGAAKRHPQRLDTLLVERGLAETRSRAQGLILAGSVRVADRIVTKAGSRFSSDEDVVVEGGDRFVSRAGEKLDGALDDFGIQVAGRSVLDAGASTGGFTDVLLQRGAGRVLSVDVGYGQLDWSLRNDPRVTVLERTNVRNLAGGDLAFAPTFWSRTSPLSRWRSRSERSSPRHRRWGRPCCSSNPSSRPGARPLAGAAWSATPRCRRP